MTAFVAFLVFSIIIYLPMRLIFDDSSWLVPGHYLLPIQTSRILLYAGYLFAGVWQLVPENLIGMGEQEPNPVRRHSNQDGRKEKTG